jgi:FlaA1/EpsC-like NDP-sugar epimerase
MGKPVRLVDMARNLIRAAGFVPDQDIAIKFIGLRPGEKLHEELVGVDEKVEATDSSRILRICPSNHQNQDALLRHIQAMENLAIHGKSDDLIKMLCSIVPNFTADAHSPEADDVSQIAS